MREIEICDMPSLYRDDFRIKGYVFGSGKKSLCIVGTFRGNEYQQQFIAAKMIRRLKELESAGELNHGYEILVIPCANPYSMNTRSKFWAIDKTDMNRVFPGNSNGSIIEIIADIVFKATTKYEYGIHLASYYMNGSFLPHVRIMKSDFHYFNEASDFMMPYMMLREPRSYEKRTLNYTWQQEGVKAFSLYSSQTDGIDRNSAHAVVRSILLFLKNKGIISTEILGGYKECEILEEETRIVPVRTSLAGFFVPKVKVGFGVNKGDLLAEIRDPCTDEIISEVISPVDGVVFFMHAAPMSLSHTAVIKLII